MEVADAPPRPARAGVAERPGPAAASSGHRVRTLAVLRLDRFLIGRTLPPMAAVLISTMVAFLMERLLRSFDLLAESSRGFDFLVQMTVNLTPHYLGLTLPSGFFIALFVVISRLNNSSEIDALLANGVSLSRLAAPFVGLGIVLMLLSVGLYGFVQPYSRYGYHAVLRAAENAGWNGEVRPRALLSPTPNLTLTADETDPSGQHLGRVFIRWRMPDGREEVFAAAQASMTRNRDNRSVTLALNDGQMLNTSPGAAPQLLSFRLFTMRVPLAPAAQLLRARGGEETELTLVELAQQGFGKQPTALHRQALLAELYSRIARSIALPLMPLLAIPFGLTAKRAGSTPAIAIAGLLLFGFQSALIVLQGMAAAGHIPAAVAIGGPTAIFAAACIAAFLASRKRPGQNPVYRLAERLADAIAVLTHREDEAEDRVRPEKRGLPQ